MQLKKASWKLASLLPLSLLLFLGGCEKIAVLNPQGPVAKQQYDLIVWSFILLLSIIVIVFVLFTIILIRYREKPDNMDYEPPDIHGNTLLEVIWTIFPVIIVIALAIPTVKATYATEKVPEQSKNIKPVEIYVTSANWKWLFSYPEEKIETVNYLNVPAGVPIQFKLTSVGPMNAFWIPELGGMKYTMDGMIMDLYLQADKPGSYLGRSANFSGEGFTHMEFELEAKTQENYDKWVKEVKETAKPLTEEKYNEVIKPGVVGRMTFSSHHLSYVDPKSLEYCDYNYYTNK
ncbi:cytochrome aa3 quinol oxidase subunit II [Bacillus sp. DX1.1]|uniref:cytochrome aa3 quinol oxidase subunit II n=1 Tax=unclassified Bacillus (in: firmicutes) TaxID=185979 RepID=UPI002571125C|nr:MULTISPECIES: cytochrome aa3 quinol oxidase subunit II [unclassified Bacillus (in: firmicutes)]MDM5153482.1 cytochrome aa3 quinol oxidase subunit II [Bacillus sp. DX1.1]WJE82437.1 cytochrome aa3 quinol oxidase subunit II [Bacillus sp. DX3.1]